MSTREQSFSAAKDIFCGSVAGSVAKVGEYPFDTVKVRLQSQPFHLPPLYAGPLDCLRQSLQNGGLKGIYRGVSAPLLGAAAENATMFMSYALAQNVLKTTMYSNVDTLPLSALVTCGAISGAVTSLVLNPIELLKCKMQVPASAKIAGASNMAHSLAPPGPLALIASIYKHHGITGFWYGQTGTLLRETGGTAAYFGSYESISAGFRRFNMRSSSTHSRSESSHGDAALPVYQRLLAGASAGMSYNFLFYPADTIKSTMQTEPVAPARPTVLSSSAASASVSPAISEQRRSFWTVGQQIYSQHGIKGFYRGCGITLCRSAPASALIFTIYESLRDAF